VTYAEIWLALAEDKRREREARFLRKLGTDLGVLR